MRKQISAVEWLVERLLVDCVPLTQRDIDKAKQMEKEQIEKALLTGLVHWDVDKPIEQYYNETFKSE